MVYFRALQGQYSISMRFFLGTITILCIVGLAWASRAGALSTSIPSQSKGLTFSPLRSELNIAPGTSHEGVLRVLNSTDISMAVHLSAESFNVTNQQYDYAFSTESDVTRWVSFAPEDIVLKPGESKIIVYTVGVPLTAEPGGRYISLFASTDTPTSSKGVTSRQRVASLIYLTVLGDVSRVGQLVSLSSPWLISGSSEWSTALRNAGTTHFRSRYAVSVNYLFGGSVAANRKGDALILPGTIRSVIDTIPLPSNPGLYEVVYQIGLGDTPAKTEKRLLFYAPPRAIAAALTVLTVVGMYLILRRTR